ncbi:MAG: type II secretion system ATPase GspE [Acidiferrobacterales bacterium]
MAERVQQETEGTLDEQLAEFLIARAKLRDADCARLRRVQQEQENHQPLSRLLVKLGIVSERDTAEALSQLLELPLAQSTDYPDLSPLNGSIPIRFLKQHLAIPITVDDEKVIVAMADPQDSYSLSALSVACGKPVVPWVGIPSEIETAIERLHGDGKSRMGQILESVDANEHVTEDDVDQLKDMASEAPVIRLVSLIIQRASDAGASDIHVEPFEDRLKVRYRIDGVLRDVEAPPAHFTAAVISRVKIMANLNIAERRLPQDGRIRLRVQGKELDVRVSTVPTMHGESVVMRLLNQETVTLDFTALGFADHTLSKFSEVLTLPYGMILVTGPTGSGKSTTLYTVLDKLNTAERKIITVEDPVEYQLEGVNQIQVKPAIGLTFANTLRSIVRQDPDVIMVGEMRDLETARICVQSALTGHLVLSTLHTNDAASSVTRLIEMGVEDYLLTSTVNAVIGQRLVRVLCCDCRAVYEPLTETVKKTGLERFVREGSLALYKPVGCEHCNGTGYRGRTAILELLVIADPIRRLVLQHADASDIQRTALGEGMHTMYEDGLRKAVAGTTTIEEIMRVTYEG